MYGCEVGESERKYIIVCAGMKCEVEGKGIAARMGMKRERVSVRQ